MIRIWHVYNAAKMNENKEQNYSRTLEKNLWNNEFKKNTNE